MSYDELDLLLGQMFIFGFQGVEVDSLLINQFQKIPVGGFILFRRNIENQQQVKKLTNDLKALSCSVRSNYELTIAVDQESGNLSPLRGLITSLPGNMGLAATGNPFTAFYAGYTTGNELKELGFNLNFAPVLDLALKANPVISTRAYSDQPDLAANFGKEYSKGLFASGIRFTAKHFPGHGCCMEDSHVELPVCYDNINTLLKRDLIPFKEVTALQSSSFMMAHVKYLHFDKEYPASLSSKIINGLLREEMGFDGVVITDCLEMNAIQKFLPYPQDAIRAIEAGNDIILISHTPEHQKASYYAVKEAVQNRIIPISRIEKSVERIRRWKNSVFTLPSNLESNPTWTSERLAEQVITFVDKNHTWKFNLEPVILVIPEMGRLTLAEDFGEIDHIQTELQKCSIPYSRINCAENPTEAEIKDISIKINSMGIRKVIFILSNTKRSTGQINLIQLLATTNQLLLVCTRNPREALPFVDKFPIIFTYSTETSVLEALAKVISGVIHPQGRLPISV